MQNRIWITWERQRRSVEMAKIFGCEFFLFDYSDFLRYPKSIIGTIWLLLKRKPNILFVQNPSMVLSSIACVYGMISNTLIVVDRHTTFRLSRKYKVTPKYLILKFLHKFTIFLADITIVTNKYIAEIVQGMGGKAFVLPDKLPSIHATKKMELKGIKNILLISSFGRDEPIGAVLEAIKDFQDQNIFLYITGNFKKLDKNLYLSSPENVIYTGFLPEEDFINMLCSVDAVLVLTTSEHVMLCGCYEAVSAEKPLITSDKAVLRDYFPGAIFIDNSPKEISEAINKIIKDSELYQSRIKQLKGRIEPYWNELFADLNNHLNHHF
jgi:glycosyltransferase involved in cell wall biosynthesis